VQQPADLPALAQALQSAAVAGPGQLLLLQQQLRFLRQQQRYDPAP
jgi:hypothetical protein